MEIFRSLSSSYSSYPLAPFLLLGFFLFLFIKGNGKSKSQKNNAVQKLPPGPWKLPVIGSLHHLAGALPHRRLRDLANKYGPFMHLQLGEFQAVVVSSSRLARETLKVLDPAFADRMGSFATEVMFYNKAEIVFSPYNDFWRQMRKICIVELLSNKNVRSFVSIREDEVWRLVSSVRSSAGSPVNLNDKIFLMTSGITCRAAFGKTDKENDTLIQLLKDLNSLAGGLDVADLFPSLKLSIFTGMKSKLVKMHQRLDVILDSIISEHKENMAKTNQGNGFNGDEDLVDVLLRLQKTGGFDFPILDKNIKGIVFDIFTGGTETSATAVEWAMSELVKNPRVMDKVQTELRSAFKGKKKIQEADAQGLDYLKLVIKETFRLHPPMPLLLPRECREECVVDGYEIPMRTKLIVNVWAIGRDPNRWKDADKFEPERFENSSIDVLGNHFELIPFGAGKRICPGMSFGMANVELPLAQLLYHFDWKVPGGIDPKDLDMSEVLGAAVGRKNKLHLIPIPYAPSFDA